jgi:hypothetical protein
MKRTDHQYKLRFPPELKARIEASAKENNRSMNAEIVEQLTAVYNIQSMFKDAPPEDEREQSPESRIRWQMSMLKMYANQIDLIRQEVEGYLSGSEEAAPTTALPGNVLLEKRGDTPSPTAKRPLRKQSRPLGMDQDVWEAKRMRELAGENTAPVYDPNLTVPTTVEPAKKPERRINRREEGK